MKTLISLLLLSLPGLLAAAEAPDEKDDTPKSVHCINLHQIDSSVIIDNQHMVFRMKGHEAYLNTLPHACPGLGRKDPYMVRTSLNQLCDLDIITMLDPTGYGLTPGASCGLGPFEAITEPQIEELKKAAKDRK